MEKEKDVWEKIKAAPTATIEQIWEKVEADLRYEGCSDDE